MTFLNLTHKLLMQTYLQYPPSVANNIFSQSHMCDGDKFSKAALL